MRKIKRIITYIILSSMLISLFGAFNKPKDAYAADGFKIYDYSAKKTTLYEGVSPTYIIDNKKIDMQSSPAIITERGVALASSAKIFKEVLGMKHYYNKSKKRIMLKKNGITLTMFIGSSTAYVNGEPIEMNAVPLRVKYKKSKYICNLVPTRFVAETFGYNYNWDAATSTVTIKTPLRIAYDGKEVNYLGTLGNAQYNGEKINLGKTPSIIISDNAMIRAKTVFKNALGIKYSYNKSTGKIKFEVGELCLEMTVGSTVAYLNGLIRASEVPPRLITMRDTGVEYLYVPGRFVAETLGYYYYWNYATSTSEISYTENVGVPPVTEELIYESSDVISEEVEPVTYFEWTSKPEFTEELKAVSAISNTDIGLGAADYQTELITVYREDVAEHYEMYHVIFSSPIKELIQYQYNNQIHFTAYSTYTLTSKYYLNGTLVERIDNSFNAEAGNTDIDFILNSSNSYYSMEMNDDNTVMTVKVYPNYITSISSGHNVKGEYLSIEGIKTPVVSCEETDGYLTLILPGTVNTISDNAYSTLNDVPINYCAVLSSDKFETTVIIKIPDNLPYYHTFNSDGKYTIYFTKSQDISENENTVLLPIELPLPSDIDMSSVEIIDNFYDKQIIFRMAGDYRSFFETHPIINTNSRVERIVVSYLSNGYTQIILQTSKVQAIKTEYKSSSLIVSLANPRDMYGKIIILDAGHGGKDPGTVHYGYNEKDMNFSIIYNYAKQLFDNSDVKVYYSRYDDTLIPLEKRASLAAEVGADMFISVHHNSNYNTTINGSSVYYSSINTGKLSSLTSKTMADVFLATLTQALGTVNRGSIDKGFVVVRDNTVPAVLLEIAFMSNPTELERIITPEFQQKVAETIFDTVNELFKAYPTGR